MNPYTDEYFAKAKGTRARHADCPRSGCSAEDRETKWLAELQTTLQDVEPAVLGQVLLHVGALLPKLTTGSLALSLMPYLTPDYLGETLTDLGSDLLRPGNVDANDVPAGGA